MNKKKTSDDVVSYIDELIDKSSQFKKIITNHRSIENKFHKISIKCVKNVEGQSGLILKIHDTNDETITLNEIFLEFSKLRNFLNKIYMYQSLPRNLALNQIDQLEVFVEKVFINHCSIVKKNDKLSFGISPKANGILASKLIQFKFLKTT